MASSGLVWNESATETLYWKSGEIVSIWRRAECELVLIELKRALKSLEILICFKIRQKRSRIRWPFAPCWPSSTWIISLFYLQKEPIDSPPTRSISSQSIWNVFVWLQIRPQCKLNGSTIRSIGPNHFADEWTWHLFYFWFFEIS